MIWQLDSYDQSTLTLVTAWDRETIEENPDGWAEEIMKAEAVLGARWLRIVQTSVDLDKIRERWGVVSV